MFLTVMIFKFFFIFRMKQSIFYFAFLMMALFGSQKGMPVENDFAIFFESINYKGKSFF